MNSLNDGPDGNWIDLLKLSEISKRSSRESPTLAARTLAPFGSVIFMVTLGEPITAECVPTGCRFLEGKTIGVSP